MNPLTLSLIALIPLTPINSQNAVTAKRRAEQLLQQNQLPEAETIAKKLLHAQPNSSTHYDLLGRIQLAEKEDLAARETYQKATQINPKDPALWANLALAARRIHDWQTAEHALAQATQITPSDATLLIDLAQVQLAKNQPEKSLITANQALALNTKNPFAFLAKASALTHLKQTQQAQQALNQALSISPNEPNCLAVLANLQIAQNQKETAINTLRRLTSRHPDEFYPQFLLLAKLLNEKALASHPPNQALFIEAFNALQTMLPLCPANSPDYSAALALRSELRPKVPK